jgi:3-phenylpropionate/trans-cinnamate dioxygenase ferredoxin subunit
MMEQHRVAPVEAIPDGSRMKVELAGRTIVVFNVGGNFYALADRCPHQGGPLSKGDQIGELKPQGAGRVTYCRRNMIVRCPWHHWAFDIETGRSQIDPARLRVRAYETAVKPGAPCAEESVPAATTFETRQQGGHVYVLL